jgi:hypothetical protein
MALFWNGYSKQPAQSQAQRFLSAFGPISGHFQPITNGINAPLSYSAAPE